MVHTELLCVLGVQSLPAVDLHRVGTDDAAEGISSEQVIQHIEADVPAGGADATPVTPYVAPESFDLSKAPKGE